MSNRAATLLLTLIVGLAAAPAAVVGAPSNDTAALLQLKAAVAGLSSDALPAWTASSDPCSATEPWPGVSCTGGRVTGVNLTGYLLEGSLPASLDLPELTVLDLSSNRLDGTLPATLALPKLQLFDVGHNTLMGLPPASWAANFPFLQTLVLRDNRLAGTLPPTWLAEGGFAVPFSAVVRPGNELLCGSVASAANHSLWYNSTGGVGGGGGGDGGGAQGAGAQHEIVTTLGSCAQNANCGVAAVNKSAPNLYDLAWSNRVATLDLEFLNPGVQLNGAPKLGSPVTLPCYPSNAPTFFGADAAYRMATWQSSTDAGHASMLPVTGTRPASSFAPEDCAATADADAPAYWMVDLQRPTEVQAVVIRGGPAQMQGVAIHVGDTPDPAVGTLCKANLTFDPNQGKIVMCERNNQGRYVSISASSRLSLCMVEVYPLAANAALGKPTSASGGDADSTSASQVVNGNMANTACATVVSGETSLAAWITIDLGYEAAVETVVVQNGFSEFKNDLEVRLGNTPVVNGDENDPCSQGQTLAQRVTLPIQCVRDGGQAAMGRFLTLYRKRAQASDMYICQVLAFLATGPTQFMMAPPTPPSPPRVPPPAPSPPSPASPDVIDVSVDDSTTALTVIFDVQGTGLVPLSAEAQDNVVLAAVNAWVGENGITNVTAVQFVVAPPLPRGADGGAGGAGFPDRVTSQLRVTVSAGLAPGAALFIQGTSEDGSLEGAMKDQGGQLLGVSDTTMVSIRAVSDSLPPPAPAPGPDNGGDGGSSGSSFPVGAVVGGVLGGVALVAALGALLHVRQRRRRGGPSPHNDNSGSESPKEMMGVMMEQGHGGMLHDFPKAGELGGYSVAALAAAAAGSGNFVDHLKLTGEPMTQGPPPEVISFLADDAVSDHSAMLSISQLAGQGGGGASANLGRESPSYGWGGSSTGGGSAAGGGGGVARTASEGGLAGIGGASGSVASGASASGALHKQRSSVAAARMDSGVSELWTVSFRELGIQKQIGEGSFGKVYLAKWRETTVAVKVLGSCGAANSPGLDDEFPDASSEQAGGATGKGHPLYESLQKEAAMMASLRHPSIVMYLGVCLDPPAVVTEYCARGSLNDVLKRAKTSPLLAAQLDWARRLSMALDAAKGMLYLHSCTPPIIHRDLKSANLLVDKHWRVRVCDFNLSRVMEDSAVLSSVAATNPRWLAPEILSGKGYTKDSDVYSFGICMWELLTWQVPYHEYGPWQVVAMVTENSTRPEIPPPEELPTGGFGGDGEYLALMTECWAQDPAARPSFELIIARLRRMLALETSVRRESPTKGGVPRAPSGVLSVGSASGSAVIAPVATSPSLGAMDIPMGGLSMGGDDTPMARSHLAASLTTASELGASPDPAMRSRGSDPGDLLLLSGSPGMLTVSASGGRTAYSSLAASAGVPSPPLPLAQLRRVDSGASGPLRTLSSIARSEVEEAEAAAAAATIAAAGDGSRPAG